MTHRRHHTPAALTFRILAWMGWGTLLTTPLIYFSVASALPPSASTVDPVDPLIRWILPVFGLLCLLIGMVSGEIVRTRAMAVGLEPATGGRAATYFASLLLACAFATVPASYGMTLALMGGGWDTVSLSLLVLAFLGVLFLRPRLPKDASEKS